MVNQRDLVRGFCLGGAGSRSEFPTYFLNAISPLYERIHMLNPILTDAAPAPAGPYSQGIVAGNLLFLAGQGPFNSKGERVGETFADQVRQTFSNLEAVANAAGTSLANAIRYGVYLKNLDDFAEFNTLAAEFLTHPLPVRTTIEAALRGFDVEIDAIVLIPHD
jgi:2-iminobutanoate/2-iminopropanoate deaminase